MLPKGQDWASLCRDYRLRHGLKQEAMAQDFHVDQSSVSRWERGLREPSMAVKQAILNDLVDAGQATPANAAQLMLAHSGSAVAIWTRGGVLHSCSPRFEAELAQAVPLPSHTGRHAADLLGDNDFVERAVAILDNRGFFDGQVMLAVFAFRPFHQMRRATTGGVITASTFPVQLPGGEIAMLSVYDHDVFGDMPDAAGTLMVSWIDARNGHSGTTWEHA